MSKTGFSQPFYDGPGWTDIGTLTYTAFGWSMSNAGDINGDGFEDMVVTAIDYSNPPETNGEEGEVLVYYGSATGLSAEPDWQFESDNDSSVLGFSSDGGDLNGDGFSDLAIGCLQWTGDQYNEGRIYLWYGSAAGLSTSGPDWNLEFDQTFALLGSSVALSGDINQDGYNDLFVSAKMWDEGEEDEGKTWLYWGSPDGPVESGWSWQADQAGAISGFPVSYAGDVNGDGYDDVVIGANQYDYVEIDDGLAVAFYGSASGLNDVPDWQASSGQKKSNFGHWVDGAGDVNGDGYDDVVVSALLYESDSAEISEGRIFVFHGGPDGLSPVANWFGEINQSAANLGYSCAGAGDINGDGYDDVIGGAKYWTNGEQDEGGAFIWFGSNHGLQTDYCWEDEGNQANGYYGRHVGGNADFNNDGYSDFMVGAYRYTTILEADGKGFVYYGAPLQSQFHYPEDSFCIADENPLPIIDGLTGGEFYSDDAVVDAVTGEINLLLSGGGIKTIHYVQSGYCPDYSIEIFIQDTVGGADIFYYDDGIYCQSEIDPTPVIHFGTTGYFYSDDVVVDSASGMVDLSESPYGGPFVVYFSATTIGGCEVLATDSIFIEYDGTFYYLEDTFCIYEAVPFPVIDDIGSGTFYSFDAGIEVNEDNGKIILPVSEVGGPYTVYYDSNSSCPVDSTIVWIKDVGPADNVFYYSDDTLCKNEGDEYPEFITPADGYFYSATAVVNSANGKIDVTETPVGLHQIYFHSDEICAIDSFQILIVDYDPAIADFHFEIDSLCINEINPIPVIDGLSGGIFTSSASIDSVTGEVDLMATGTGAFMIIYTAEDANGCNASSAEYIFIFEDADASFFYSDTSYYQDGSDPAPTTFDTSGIFYFSPAGLLMDEDGTINVDSSAIGTYVVYYQVSSEICTVIDSFTIMILPPCTAPLSISIDSLAPTAAEISWEGDDYYTDYFVFLVNGDDTLYYIVENADSILFTGLDPLQTYLVYVFTDCLGDSSYIATQFTLPVSINEINLSTGLKIYPNPAQSILSVEVNNLNSDAEIIIKSMNGDLIYSKQVNFNSINKTAVIQLNEMTAGIYLVEVITPQKIYFGNVMINR